MDGQMVSMPRNTEKYQLLSGEPLVIGGKQTLGKNFKIGEGWYQLDFRFNIIVTIGTGAGPITEGELNIIKSITLKSDKSEYFISAVPGRALFKAAIPMTGSIPQKDAIAAASATYSVNIPVVFADEKLMRPNDLIIDTGRYQQMTLEVNMGTVADLFTAPGTASITATLDLVVKKTKEVLPVGGGPLWYMQYQDMPPQIASTQTFVDIERSSDLGIMRLFVHSATAATAGSEWSGTNDDTIQNVVQLKDGQTNIIQDLIHAQIQADNKSFYGLESIVTGLEVHDFVSMTGSLRDTIFTGDKSRLQYSWSNQAGVGATDQVTVLVQGARDLRE